jgi:hypothetical protein
MSRPVSAMTERARSSLRPGICASRARGGQDRGVRAHPGAGAGGAVAVGAPGLRDRPGGFGDPGGELGDLGVQRGDLVQQQGRELAVVVIEHAVQGRHEVVVPGFHPGPGQGGQRVRVTLPGDHRLDHVLRRDSGQLGRHR